MKSNGNKITWFLVAITGLLLGARDTVAQNPVTWNVPGPAPWADDLNWDTMFVPDASFDDNAIIGNGGTAEIGEAVNDVVNMMLNNGTVSIQQGGSLTVEQATTIGGLGKLRLSGNGTFQSNTVSNGGLIELPSDSVSFSTGGNYTNQGTGTLSLGISSAGSPVLDVGGTARMGGTLLANIASGVDISFGSSWPFLAADSVTGQFSQITLPAGADPLPLGLEFRVETSGGNASLTVGNLPVLTLDRATGRSEIKNIVGGPLTLNSYSIVSERGLLSPQNWTSLQSQQLEGWTEANPRAEGLAELNLTGSSTLEVGGSGLNLGSAYNAAAGANPREEDVTWQFSTPSGEILTGLVEYTGPPNDLVLRVDPETGEAAIRNLSSFIEPFDVTGYSILSESGALSVDNWVSFTDSGEAGAGWVEANPLPEALAELNLEDAHLFGTGTVINLGAIFAPGSSRDLQFEFTTAASEFLMGTVEYGMLDDIQPPPGDCNGDGVVNVMDANCTPADQLLAFLAANNLIQGDADGNGEVQFPDFVTLANNFGNPGQYTDGDFDKDGTVQFPDFVILANNFGQISGGAAAVPEPSSLALGLAAAALLMAHRRGRGTTNS